MTTVLKTFWQKPLARQIPWAGSVALLFHILAVFFSEGHDKLDEHDGILMMTAYQLDLVGKEFLHPHEYPAQIRSWFQPFLYALWLRPFVWLGVENPFTLTLLLRSFSSALGMVSLVMTFRLIPKFIREEKAQIITLWSLALFWYLPFLHARTTAESLGMSFFMMAFFFYFKEAPDNYFHHHSPRQVTYAPASRWAFLGGVFLSLSFSCRLQMVILILGFLSWALMVSNIRRSSLGVVAMGALLCFVGNILLDSWFYGEWTFIPWNYWHYNIVKGVANSMGVDPFYYYIEKVLVKGIPPLSFLFFIPIFWILRKNPWHILVWLILPFFMIHSLISHKELRFLYPLSLFLPLALGVFYCGTQKLPFRKFLFGINFLALLIATLRPAHSAMGLHRILLEKKITTIKIDRVPNLFFPFYLHKKSLQFSDSSPWVLSHPLRSEGKYSHCQKIYQSYPDWILSLLPSKYWERSKIFTLSHCSQKRP